MGKRKYKTEEERIAAQRESWRRWREKNKEKLAKQKAEYYQNNKEKIAARKAEYYQNNKEKIAEYGVEYRKNNKGKIAARKAEYYQNNKEKIAEYMSEYHAEYRKNNKEKIAEYMVEYRKNNKEYFAEYYRKNKEYFAEYYQNNKEKIAEYMIEYRKNNKEKLAKRHAEYRSTKYGRAKYLLNGYQRSDCKNKVIKALNRGECTLTVDWIVDNIFSGQSCVYCGESDWTKLGCDRKDSWFPHTPENCVPCCNDCNTKKGTTPYDLYMKMIGKIA